MDCKIENAYIEILETELMPALGCTEPGAIAYATAKAKELLQGVPDHIDILCSGNIVKNVKGVIVPNSGGMRGIEAAAILGVLADCSEDELEVLQSITPEDQAKARELVGTGFCKTALAEEISGLYIQVIATKGEGEAEVVVKDHHTNIVFLRENDKVLYDERIDDAEDEIDYEILNVRDIIEFANTVDVEKIAPVIRPQIECNTAIAREGMSKDYGAAVGRTIIETEPDSVKTKARAFAAAGSDARMGGCSMPVIVNSGSGNQGITMSVPVVIYAQEMGLPEEKLIRALVVSNLISVHVKKYIGALSAFCGAVTDGMAAGTAITYLKGGGYEEIGMTIINALGSLGGVICDGAKASCAAKIASSVEWGFVAGEMAFKGRTYPFGEGIVTDDLEKTIQNIGRVAREGMHDTDLVILKIMLEDENRGSFL